MSAFSEEKLPNSFSHEIESISSGLIIIRSSVNSLEDINKWTKEFGKSTNTRWNTRTSRPYGQRFVCLKKFVCHHSAFMKVPTLSNRRSFSKNSGCQATILIKVLLNTGTTRRRDPFIKKGLCSVITINDVHNHSLNTAEALKFLPTSDCKETFLEYFNDGMGISEACKYHEGILQLEEKYTEEDMANSQINPPYRSVQYWYDKWRIQNVGPRTGQGVIEKMKEKLKIYEDSGITVNFSDNPFAVVIMTPIMKRAHNLKSSSEIVFVNSTSSCDPENHSITFMLCPCSAGAVPLAVIITKGQTTDSYVKGFQILNEMLQNPFNGKGHPEMFMTDDSEAEIKALQNVWPTSRHLLCIFHVAQAVWRWLWDSKHEIPKEHRNKLMNFFQRILYAHTIQEAEEAYKNSCAYVGDYLPTYENWNIYLKNYWEKRELWCLSFRNEKVRGYHTNNFSEVCIRIFKDEVLCRVKACNVLTMSDFIATHLEKHYVKKFRDFANSRCANSRLFLLSLKKKAANISKNDITVISENTFSVKSDKNFYIVNIKSGCCSCPEGLYGRYCKHQYSVFHHYDIIANNFRPIRPENKYEMAVLALGNKAPPRAFFEPLILEVSAVNEMQEAVPDEPTKSFPAICKYKNDENSYEEKRENILNEIHKEFTEKDKKHKSSLSGLSKFLKSLKNIKTPGSWESFLHTAGNRTGIRQKNGAAIRVQPTSIARLPAHVTKGSKRLPEGRPNCGPSSKKRKHSLAKNIKLNQPNTKRH